LDLNEKPIGMGIKFVNIDDKSKAVLVELVKKYGKK